MYFQALQRRRNCIFAGIRESTPNWYWTVIFESGAKLARQFKETDLGKCNFFLVLRIEKVDCGLFLSQPRFKQNIIELSHMESAKTTPRPLQLSHPLYDQRIYAITEKEESMRKIP